MDIDNELDVPVLILLGGVLLATVFFMPNLSVVRIALGTPFIFFFPGYSLVLALFPSRGDLEGLERLGLSIGLSFAIVPLVALVLNFTYLGVRLFPVMVSLYLLVISFSIIGYYRRKKRPRSERFRLRYNLKIPGWRETSVGGKITVIGFIAIVVAAGFVGTHYLPKNLGKESFTEFYVTGGQGKLEGYPSNLTLGETANVTLGVVNHENKVTNYRVVAELGNKTIKEIKDIRLSDEGKWRKKVHITPKQVGNNLKLSFFLYKEGNSTPCRKLDLWLNVSGR